MAKMGQVQIFNQPAQAVQGDRASQNPIATYDAGPGGLVADASGVTVGNFCWVTPPTDPNGTGQFATQANGAGNVAGFLYNDLQALDTVFLSDAGLIIPQGLPVALATQGVFWVVNMGTTEAQVGQKAYASLGTGAVSFAATGAPTQAASATGSSIAAETFSVTASIASDVMTVTAVGSGTVYPGSTISGTGVAAGTMVSSQITPLLAGETAGGVGRYLLSVSQQKAIASETISGTYGLLTIGTLTTTPVFAVGQTLTVSGSVVAGTVITANVTGAGGSGGTMVVSNNTVVSSTAISVAASNVETKWFATTSALAGELVKISAHSLG